MHKKTFSLFLLSIGYCFLSIAAHAQSPADSLLNFIAKNKKRASISLSRNDTMLIKYNENKSMPLAGSVYIMVAVEFAKQAGSNVIDEDSYIGIKDLDKYYIPEVDSVEHQSWLAAENSKGHIIDDSIRLINVARGMMMFNDNTNAEYLMDLLGMDNVKSNIQLFGLSRHTPIFPVVSSFFLYQNPRKLKENDVIDGIKSLSNVQYCKTIYEIHKALKFDTSLKPKYSQIDFTTKMQKLWSDRLPTSTTNEYVQIGKILNNRKFIQDAAYGVLAETMEFAMEDPTKLKWLKHEGMKSGTTPWVLTKVLYATTQQGVRIEMAYFFNELTPAENKKLQSWMNDFEDKLLTDESFRQKVAKILS